MRIVIGIMLLLLPVWAADNKPFQFDKLAAKAIEKVDVTLDSSMLQLAGRWLSNKDADEAKAKQLIGGLKSIVVKVFEFAKEGEYSAADVEAIRAQLKAPGWSRVVDVQSKIKSQTAEVYFKKEGEKIGGLAILAAEPKELTFVHIDGAIDPEQLGELGGHFGIPKIDIGSKSKPAKD